MTEMYATAKYKPQPDITVYELARVIDFIMRCGSGKPTDEAKVNFYFEENLNQFKAEYADILHHFVIVMETGD
jgi:hypothetical protein